METFASAAVLGLTVYVALGVAFGLPFVVWGVKHIDPAASGGTWGFRLLILPGCAALWPLLLLRLVRGAAPPEEKSPHRHRARHPAGPAASRRGSAP
jgi:hypothetical protein